MSPLFTLVSNAKTLSMNIYQRRDKRQTLIYYCHVLRPTTATVNTSTNPNTHTYVNIYQVLRLTFLYWPESGTRADNLGRGDT